MSTGWQSPDLFGRNYSLSISLQNGGSFSISSADMEPDALRFTFEVEMHVQSPLWWAEITIYNLDYNTAKRLTELQQGDTIVLQAGYKNGIHQMATIFEGTLFQPFFHRSNVVDFKLTLQCFAGNAKNFVSTNFSRLQSQMEIVQQAMRAAYSPISQGQSNLAYVLSTVQLPRGGVIFGDTNKVFSQAARDYHLTTWLGPDGGLNIVDLGSLLTGAAPQPTHDPYAPPIPPGSNQKASSSTDYSIVGTPQQTWAGVNLTVLLDPSLKVKYPPDVIQIDMSSTQLDLLPLPGPLGSGPGFIPPPDPSGIYIVAGVKHSGDTRGNPWYTDITGVTQNGLALSLNGHY